MLGDVLGIVGARSVVLWRLSLSKPEQNNAGESRNPEKPDPNEVRGAPKIGGKNEFLF